MAGENGKDVLERNISSHVFSASASMVGLSLTALGVFRISDRLKNVSTIGDELLAINAVGFLLSCLLSYLCLRGAFGRTTRRVERVAEVIFLAAMIVMVVICGLIAYELL